MAEYFEQMSVGSLALDQARHRMSSEFSAISENSELWHAPELEEERERNALALAREEERLLFRKERKNMSILRSRKLLQGVALLIGFSLMFAGLMFRQAEIFEKNFSNTRLRNEISEARKKNSEMREDMLRQSDMKVIADDALRLFGLRKPSQLQRVPMVLPKSDKTVLYDQNDSSEAKLQNEKNNTYVLEAYIKALRHSDQNDNKKIQEYRP
ncbi:MAG: hypothetical protein MSC43_02605 [Clostridiales bacterium]|nr:hypothetical protein [Clostridiales bacterium]MDD7433218.1 hypothetical protein [Clostridiales bacterium]